MVLVLPIKSLDIEPLSAWIWIKPIFFLCHLTLDTPDPNRRNIMIELLPDLVDLLETTLKAGPSKSALLSFFFPIRLQNQLMNKLISPVCRRGMTQSGFGDAGLSSSITSFNQSGLVLTLRRCAISVSSEFEIFVSSGIGTSSTGYLE
ncbi:hypothetical protein Tco_1082223 [Tanacetum coccineum]|uniref:DUF4283 domain-containing protein n=1 Tax=Tanacetum coccineum TaxID=301880 RepID=A0ABQ5HZU4_9ASTR